MPDKWERAHQLDPKNPDDGSAVSVGGSTNLEIYLNALAARN
jgi:hypothetical protein